MAMQRQLTRVGCTFNVHEICVLPVCQSPVHDISHWGRRVALLAGRRPWQRLAVPNSPFGGRA